MYQKGCLFCDISQKKIKSYTIWEDSDYMAFLSIFPNTDGLTVVIPKQHRNSYIFDNSNEDIANIMIASKEVGKIIQSKLKNVGRVGVIFEGMGVNHLHSKLIPMYNISSEKWEKKARMIETKFDSYPGYLSSHDSFLESDEKLESIAKLLTS